MKTRVAVLCGGQSVEHEVSLRSARNVVDAIDRRRYHVTVVGIDKQGVWKRYPTEAFLDNPDNPKSVSLAAGGTPVATVRTDSAAEFIDLDTGERQIIDVLFPVLHGTNGEDGAVQGLAQMLNCPCVGCDLASSANCMDKKTAKALLRAAGLPVARGLTVEADTGWLDVGGITAILGLPLFVKPARLGSSVGITKVKHAGDLQQAVKTALRFDTKVLIEEFVDGREIECAVLGDQTPKASVPGEIVPADEWYSYDAKYVLEDGARLVAPAQLDPEQVAAIQDLAVRAYQALGCSGMARVDFFMRTDGSLVINELNTIPGFTNISMYPKLWDISGTNYAQLVDRLIELALERHARLSGLDVDYQTAT